METLWKEGIDIYDGFARQPFNLRAIIFITIHDYQALFVLALLKYPFYPLFILDNGMNLISKSLTVLTPA